MNDEGRPDGGLRRTSPPTSLPAGSALARNGETPLQYLLARQGEVFALAEQFGAPVTETFLSILTHRVAFENARRLEAEARP